MKLLFTREEARKILNISISTLDRLKKNGKISYFPIGDRVFYRRSDMAALLYGPENDPEKTGEILERIKAMGGEI
jgi:predicted site-specific integrase-resolvase